MCSLLTPFFVIGIFTYIVGVYFDIPILVMLSILNISGCSGDLVMFNFISKLKNIEFTEFDDATSFALYSSNDISKFKHKGLKYIGKKEPFSKAILANSKVQVVDNKLDVNLEKFAYPDEFIKHGSPDEIVPKFLETVPQAEQVEKVEHTEEIIRVKDIKKHYYSIERGVVKAVDGVSLTINQGEIYGIVGLSGSGKTTLTRMMIGLTEPSAGELEIKLGDDWIDMKKPGPLNRGRVTPYLGLLHQEYSLYPHRDILGNLTDAISLNLPAEFAKIKAAHILETVGFEKEKSMSILSKWQDELSGGERHRVALAQVLIKEPNIVVLDEPTGTMDPVTRIIVTNSILKARDELDQTFVIISHDMDFVLDVCDKASLMRGGKLLSTGTPEEIVAELTGEEKADMIKDH